MLLQNFPWPQVINYSLTALYSLIAILIFVKMLKYIRNELKTAPKYTFRQKFTNFSSGVIFSLMTSLSIMFVLALISSAISKNGQIILNTDQIDTDISKIFLNEILEAFAFPRYLPIILIIIAIFSLFYPLYEYLKLASPGQQGATEIQRHLESRYIDRFNPPWSYIAAIVLFFFIVLLAPIITSIIATNQWNIPENITDSWAIRLIFFVWLLLGPMFYLSYYSNIGAVQTFFRGRRVNLKNDKKLAIFYGVAILTFISSVWSFFQYIIPIITNTYPKPGIDFFESQTDFVNTLFDIFDFLKIVDKEGQRPKIRLFFAVFPIDFLGFILTTAGFGLIGIYSKFISKEPLNSPKMVLFAAYIICGIAFSIFVTAMVKWPWIFPDENLQKIGLDLILSPDARNPEWTAERMWADQETVVRLFSTAILVQKILNLIFLGNFLFHRKELRQEADEWALNKAILENDFETINKYKVHESVEMRKIVANSVIRYVKMKDTLNVESSEQISKIMEELLSDENTEITSIIKAHQYEIMLKLDEDSIITSIINLLKSEDANKTKQAIKLTRQVGKRNIVNLSKIIEELKQKQIPDVALNKIFNVIAEFDRENHEYLRDLVIPLLSDDYEPFILASFQILNAATKNFQKNLDVLTPYFHTLLQHHSSKIVARTLDTYSTLASSNQNAVATLMTEFNHIDRTENNIIQEKIATIVKFCMIQTKWFENLFDYMEIYLKSTENQVISDAAIGLGSLSSNISPEEFFNRIFPHFKQLVQHSSTEVKKATLASLVIIAQTRPEIYKDERFQHLFSVLIIDEDVDIRHQVYRFFIEGDPHIFINDIVAILSAPLSIQIRIDLMNILAIVAEKIVPYMDEVLLFEVLKKQEFIQSKTLFGSELKSLQEDNSKIFGFHRNFEEINLMGATVALIYDLLYFAPNKMPQIEDFLNENVKHGGDLALAKKFEFYCKQSLDHLDGKTFIGQFVDVKETLSILDKNIYIVKPLAQKVVVDFLWQVFKKDVNYHKEILVLLVAISLQKDMPDANTRKMTLICMASIFAQFPDIYFGEIQFQNLTNLKTATVNPFEKYFKPYLLKNMDSNQKEVQDGITTALYKILEATDQEKFIRKLLIEAINQSKGINAKITAMKAIVSLPIKIDDKETTATLLRQQSSKNIEVRAQAIRSLGQIIRTYPSYTTRKHSRHIRSLKSLIYRVLFNPYKPNAPIEIKKAILEHLGTITLIQPNIPVCLSTIEAIGLDPDPKIAIQAVEIFFQFVDLYPDKMAEIMVVFRRLSNSPFVEINRLIVQKLLDLQQSGMKMTALYSSLIKLATSPSKEIRIISLQAFYDISIKVPEQFDFFIGIIMQLSTNRQPEVRQDACNFLFKFAYLKGNELKPLIKILARLQNLAGDPDIGVRIQLSKNLQQMVDHLPQQINDVLQIIYTLIRGSGNHSEIIQNLALTLKGIWNTHPDLNEEMLAKLQRFYKKSQNAILYTLVNDLKSGKVTIK
ncbi:hypothetical protein [Candidatus Lokiarchaeum ossiferum]|uniref:hypothetical protein n=1 Tax=Candidatus Lokiarchaeum ossiferum TaxID=2951803 RepID=UPI00352EA421